MKNEKEEECLFIRTAKLNDFPAIETNNTILHRNKMHNEIQWYVLTYYKQCYMNLCSKDNITKFKLPIYNNLTQFDYITHDFCHILIRDYLVTKNL